MMPQVTRQTPYGDLPEWLTPDEFRAHMGLSRSAIYDLIKRAEIPHKRFGKLIYIPKTACQLQEKE